MSYTQSQKLSCIEIWQEHGLQALLDACKLSDIAIPSRSSLYSWYHQKQYKGKYTLCNHTTRPNTVRQSRVTGSLLTELIRIRRTHPNYGKMKIWLDLKKWCIKHRTDFVSPSTIGRTLTHLKANHIISELHASTKVSLDGNTGKIMLKALKNQKNTQNRKTRRKDYKATVPGDVVQIDTVVFYLLGVKRYILTAIDIYTRQAWTYATSSHSSLEASKFLKRIQTDLIHQNTELQHIQTDNGSEFHLYFQEYAKNQGITHFFNYPRHPNQNAFIERFNRTVQEEHLLYHLFELKTNLALSNLLLAQWTRWYNRERYHTSLDYMTPYDYTQEVLHQKRLESRM